MKHRTMRHVAIFKGDGAERILSGQKTIESRFAKGKIAPFGVVSTGDLVYIKPTGADLIGQFKVKRVIFYDGLGKEEIREIREKYGMQLAVDDNYWKNKEKCRYGTLIFIGESTKFITSPIKLKKKDQRGWVVLEN